MSDIVMLEFHACEAIFLAMQSVLPDWKQLKQEDLLPQEMNSYIHNGDHQTNESINNRLCAYEKEHQLNCTFAEPWELTIPLVDALD